MSMSPHWPIHKDSNYAAIIGNSSNYAAMMQKLLDIGTLIMQLVFEMYLIFSYECSNNYAATLLNIVILIMQQLFLLSMWPIMH
jgi:hypothetical protein